MTMGKTKILYILHNHPTLHPGGAEAYAVELYEAMQASSEFEPLLIARTGSNPNFKIPRTDHPGAPFSSVNGDPHQYFIFTDMDNFDFFTMSSRDKSLYTTYFEDFLLAHKPDVVHFQHTLFIGYDLISETRRVLPEAPILYTLHEYVAICHHDGQLKRTENKGEALCLEASPRRCHECFPLIQPQDFFLRKRFIQSHYAHVDLFLAPSKFLLERYVDWGIPREKIRFEDYGRLPVKRVSAPTEERPRIRIGYFGQLNRFKGVDVLLKAMRMLGEYGVEAHLWLHGGNLERQPEDFQTQFKELLTETEGNVTFGGRYDHAALPALISDIDWVVVPSVWWENSPLVIQEAFLHGRPVICSDIGGMAEKVTDGVNGLHFRAGDPKSLAETIHRAVATPGLWEELQAGIPVVFPMGEHVANLSEIYRDLVERYRGDGRAALGGGRRLTGKEAR
jgi:glycosyltransferase involved in cell wall biosynthesis